VASLFSGSANASQAAPAQARISIQATDYLAVRAVVGCLGGDSCDGTHKFENLPFRLFRKIAGIEVTTKH
jgi:hypothetical protein